MPTPSRNLAKCLAFTRRGRRRLPPPGHGLGTEDVWTLIAENPTRPVTFV